MRPPPPFDRHHIGLAYWLLSICLCTAVHGQISSSTDVVTTPSTTSTQSVAQSSITSPSTTQSTTTPTSPPLPVASGIQTCPPITINYITHILPQKCLKANWTGLVNYTATASSADQDAAGETGVINGTIAHETVGSEASDGDVHLKAPEEIPVEGSATASEAASAPEATATDTDSPLDNAKFLSFEEWKLQNMEKAVQAQDGQGQASTFNPAGNVADAVDSMGTDSQMEIGFEGFGVKTDQKPSASPAAGQASQADAKPPAAGPRKKEAGTTSKERFNYASFDCAANILKTNGKCKSSSSVLVENKDSYMLNECSTKNKFLIVELCNDILVDTVVLANFEFFSSMFRTFRISVSDRYPAKLESWKELGTFEARNAREIQAFAIQNPQAFVKYLRVEFLSHYGNEHYCPVSLLRVHGTTMIEDLRNQDSGRMDDEEMAEIQEVTVAPAPVPSEAVSVVVEQENPVVEGQEESETISTSSEDIGQDSAAIVSHVETVDTASISTIVESSSTQSSTHVSVAVAVSSTSISSLSSNQTSETVSTTTIVSHSTASGSEQTQVPSAPSQSASEQTHPPISISSTSSVSSMSTTASKVAPPPAPPKSPQSVQPPAPSPTTQENIFKSLQNRLQVLEANATLSLQYIEEQSRILRDAFSIVEKRQMGKTEDFLRHLNDSVIFELKTFRQQYDQLWQSTVLELEAHRQQYQRELIAVTTRLTIVADELLFQKRMAIVQTTLVLLCIGLVLFARSGSSTLELPLMQHVLNKSHSVLGLQAFDSLPASPASASMAPRSGSPRRQVMVTGRDSQSAESMARSRVLARTRSEEFGGTEDDDLDEDAQIIDTVEPQELSSSSNGPSPSFSAEKRRDTEEDSSKEEYEHRHRAGNDTSNTPSSTIYTPTQTPAPSRMMAEEPDVGSPYADDESTAYAVSEQDPDNLTTSESPLHGFGERVAALKQRGVDGGNGGFTRSFSGPATPRGTRDLLEREVKDVEWDERNGT